MSDTSYSDNDFHDAIEKLPSKKIVMNKKGKFSLALMNDHTDQKDRSHLLFF